MATCNTTAASHKTAAGPEVRAAAVASQRMAQAKNAHSEALVKETTTSLLQPTHA